MNAPTSPMTPAPLGQIFDRSWKVVRGQLALFAGLSAVLMMALGAVTQIPYVSWLLSSPFTAGFIACCLRLRRGENFDFADFFWAFGNLNRFLNIVLASVLSGLFLIVGFVLLIVPSIWVAVCLTFWTVLMVRYDLDAIASLRRSYELVRGSWWRVFGLVLFIGGLNFLGFLCVLVGVLVSIPLGYLMMIEMVEELEREKAPSGGTGPLIKEEGASSSFAVNPPPVSE